MLKKVPRHEQKEAPHEPAQGYHTRGRVGYAALPDHHGRVETTLADLRQADDLLPAFGHDAGGYPRDRDDHHAAGPRPIQTHPWRRKPMGPVPDLHHAALARWLGAGLPSGRGFP